jgi:uracil phosphoribosyltransferase
MKEVSTLVLYEATHHLKLGATEVVTSEGGTKHKRAGSGLTERLGVAPILRGGLGMAEAATEMIPTAQVWHLGIYRDKASLMPVEYYNKLPKAVSVERVYVLDPMPISGSTAVAAIDILKSWGSSAGHPFEVELVSLVATAEAVKLLTETHPNVHLHIGMIDDSEDVPMMPSLGDVGDRLFNTF